MCKLATCEISIFQLVSVAEETGLKLALSETLKTGFLIYILKPIINNRLFCILCTSCTPDPIRISEIFETRSNRY